MNHEDLNLVIAKRYVEDKTFRNEYESLMEQRKGAMDALKKNFIPNHTVFKLKESEIESEFAQKVADLCSKTVEEKKA